MNKILKALIVLLIVLLVSCATVSSIGNLFNKGSETENHVETEAAVVVPEITETTITVMPEQPEAEQETVAAEQETVAVEQETVAVEQETVAAEETSENQPVIKEVFVSKDTESSYVPEYLAESVNKTVIKDNAGRNMIIITVGFGLFLIVGNGLFGGKKKKD